MNNEKEKIYSRCPKCKTQKELISYKSIHEDNVYQDDTGKWTICQKCNNAYGVEY